MIGRTIGPRGHGLGRENVNRASFRYFVDLSTPCHALLRDWEALAQDRRGRPGLLAKRPTFSVLSPASPRFAALEDRPLAELCEAPSLNGLSTDWDREEIVITRNTQYGNTDLQEDFVRCLSHDSVSARLCLTTLHAEIHQNFSPISLPGSFRCKVLDRAVGEDPSPFSRPFAGQSCFSTRRPAPAP